MFFYKKVVFYFKIFYYIEMKNIALITGGCKRLGKEISLHLANSGYDIIIHCNKSFNIGIEIKKKIESIGRECFIYKADFSTDDGIIEFINSIKKRFNKLSLLVNNAGYFKRKPLSDSDTHLINEMININLKSPLLLTKYFSDILKGGQIINILDSKIFNIDANYFIYSLTKKSLADITKLSAKEFSPDIRINGIALGLLLKNEDENKKKYENFDNSIPLNKYRDKEYFFQTIDFLINNKFITGEIISLDGGYNLLNKS